MPKAKDFMAKPVLSVKEDSLAADAAKLLAEKHVSCLTIERKGQLIGILTERDLVREVIAKGLDPLKTKVRDVMDTDLHTIVQTMELFDIIAFMRKNGLRRVIVAEGKKAIGVITETDIVNETLRMEGQLVKDLESKKMSVQAYQQKHREILGKLQSIKTLHNKISTGSKDFDSILNGGFPLGSSILIYGPSGAGKTLVAFSFLYQGLQEGDSCIYISVNEQIKEIRSGFKSLGYNVTPYEKQKKMLYMDLSSDKNEKKDPSIIYSSSNMQFKDIYYIKRIVEETQKNSKKHTLVFVNVVSQALMLWSPEIVYRFVADLSEFFRSLNITALFLLDKGIGTDNTISAIEQAMDGAVYFNARESGLKVERQLFVKKMKGGTIIEQKYHTFDFKPKMGITLKKEQDNGSS